MNLKKSKFYLNKLSGTRVKIIGFDEDYNKSLDDQLVIFVNRESDVYRLSVKDFKERFKEE